MPKPLIMLIISILIAKLCDIGIEGMIGEWIGTFLVDRKQHVKIRDTLSEEEEIKSGVSQGSVLGPFLSLVFIQDLGGDSEADTLLYVDDNDLEANFWMGGSG